MRKGNSEPLSPELAAELVALEAMPDETIDTSEIPEVRDWSGAQRGRFYQPKGPGHLTLMNRGLRAAMLNELRRKWKGEAA
jgi:hypothetical protein